MKKRDHQSQPSVPHQEPQQSHGALNEAQALFERMKGEVVASAEREQEETRARGPFV